MDIRDFVPYEQIDPIYFEQHVLPRAGTAAEKVYALLRARHGGVRVSPAIVTFVMRDKQHLGCLRVREGVDHAGAHVLRRRDPRRRRGPTAEGPGEQGESSTGRAS